MRLKSKFDAYPGPSLCTLRWYPKDHAELYERVLYYHVSLGPEFDPAPVLGPIGPIELCFRGPVSYLIGLVVGIFAVAFYLGL